jgi:CelD/BcsL family acetyltransferase involved in cellulose biosynthesis
MRPGVFSSPGRTLLGLVAMAAAEDGLDELDLLRGDHEYKERFASGVRSDLRIRLVKATPAVGAAAARRLPAGLTLLVERLRPGPSGTS